jgi:two-component system cell cycle response regulator
MVSRTGRLLIAEDEENLRNLLVRYFSSLGHSVEACADGAAALGRLATGQYDVVLTDVLMPGTNGLDVMRAAKAADRFVEVVFLTGAPDLSTTVQALREGDAFDYIVKPFPNVEVLRATIDRALERRELRKENERLVRELERVRSTDPVTGSLTRRAFFDQGERELARAARHHEPLSLFMIDLDHFEQIADEHGLAVADTVLLQFIQICRELLRTEDLLARYWGDKFVCLLPVTDIQSAETVAGRILAKVASVPLQTGENVITMHASAGVASRQDADRSLDTLVRRAERALRHAKDRGGNRVHTER